MSDPRFDRLHYTSREFRDHNDALAAHTSFTRYITKWYETQRHAWVEDRWLKYGAEAAAPSLIAYTHMIEDVLRADTVWMTTEMMDLTQRAMEGFHHEQQMSGDDLLIPHGFMVLPQPFYSADINGKLMADRAYLWRWVDALAVVTAEHDSNGGISYTYDLNADGLYTVGGIRITVVSHIDDADDYSDDMLLPQLAERGIEWGIVHTTAIPQPLIHRLSDTRGEGDHDVGWLRFFRVAHNLMGNRIVTSDRQQALRAFRRDAMRAGLDMGAPRIITLRRPNSQVADEERERTRDVEWTHRWIVSGHWRHLADGRQTWIGEYVKGPENLPLIVRERVWNWNR